MSLEKSLCEELNHCSNCGSQSLSFLLVEGKTFCNWVCVSEWKWKKEHESQNSVGKMAPKNRRRPSGSTKKMKLSELKERKRSFIKMELKENPHRLVVKEEAEG